MNRKFASTLGQFHMFPLIAHEQFRQPVRVYKRGPKPDVILSSSLVSHEVAVLTFVARGMFESRAALGFTLQFTDVIS